MKKLQKKLKVFFHNFVSIISKPEMAILPGQLAFFFVLAIVPTISLITYGASFLKLSSDVIYNFLANVFSSDIAGMLVSTNISVDGNTIKFIVVLMVAYYIASNGLASIIITSNTIYGIKNRGFFRRRLKAFIMTFIMIFLFAFILVVPVFGNSIMELISTMSMGMELKNDLIWVINLLKGPISWFIIFLLIKLIYTKSPDRKIKSRSTNYGALFTTVCWILGTYLYSFYISKIANYNAFYGGLANVVILMLWFYFLSYIFTIGMALNYHKEEEETYKTEALKLENNK